MNTPYATLNLTETSPEQSLTEAFDIPEIQGFLGLPLGVSDPVREAELLGYIIAAREQAEILQGRDLAVKQWDMRRDTWYASANPLVSDGRQYQIGNGEIPLRASLQSVDLITYTDSAGNTTTMAGTDYIMDAYRHPGVVMPPYGRTWPVFIPYPSSAVLIRFTAGWTADRIPRLVKQGMLLLISAWFNNKLPFEIGASAIQEYPFAVTSCLSYGQIPRVR